ncbi:hypothetical protein QKW35_10340 [Pontibacterium granulatum]|uniref:hypothetical protein n=1 Tax=Pontibacterium granulatum TaxID=2036029 RepID=UPI00249B3293|nr:hypothetical protein [Pontibacterium granulatum]MDI3324775.1 hypothetical protein [Pontibacterium granulatum]
MKGTKARGAHFYLFLAKKITQGFRVKKTPKIILVSRIIHALSDVSEDSVAYFSRVCYRNRIITSSLNLKGIKSDLFIDRENQYDLPLRFQIKLFEQFVKDHAADINTFYDLKCKLESALIIGDYEQSLSLVDRIDSLCGSSIWAIDARMSIYNRFKKLEELDRFKESFNDSDISHVAHVIYSKHTAKSPEAFKNQVLGNLLKEFRSNGSERYADLLSLYLLPRDKDKDISVEELLYLSQKLSPVDRLFIYKRVSVAYLDVKGDFSYEWERLLFEFSEAVCGYLTDTSWTHISDARSGGICIRVDSRLRKIIQLYSSGDYERVVKCCEAALVENPRDFSVMDIYSRALIYLGRQDELDDDDEDVAICGVHQQIATTLCSLLISTQSYQMSKSTLENFCFRWLCFDFIFSLRPLCFTAYPFVDQDTLSSSCKTLGFSEFDLTPKYYSFALNGDEGSERNVISSTLSVVDYENLSESRKLRYDLEVELSKSTPDSQKVDAILSGLVSVKDILASEYMYLWANSKICVGSYMEVINRVSEGCINSIKDSVLYPLRKMSSIISGDRERYEGEISALICYYFNFRLNDFSSKEATSEFLKTMCFL